jgi:membrane associated rhomboid family serine protease
MRFNLKKIPATVSLNAVNVLVFAVIYLKNGSQGDGAWTLTLLRSGAEFNPLTLDKEWYRIFTHMFLHGGILHLAVNMYALYSVGGEVEMLVGTKKFTVVYFVSGVAAALNSLYWSLFAIGVGASGAIFGVFGFSLMINIFLSRRSGKSMTPVLVNFAVFVVINLAIAKSVNADNAAHLGGLAAGMLMGGYALVRGGGAAFVKIQLEYLLALVLVVIFFSLPRYQVHYYKFFQYVLAAEDSSRNRITNDLSDSEYLKVFQANNQQWDTALSMLNNQQYLPAELSADTFKLRRYIGLRKKENIFKTIMIERESYIYLDSVASVHEAIPQYMSLDYGLSFREPGPKPPTADIPPREPIKVLYDSEWIEVPSPPAAYYRLGFRDSLGRWDGLVRDFYATGAIQMKGSYVADKRDGIFLYYSDHNTYVSAGRYRNDESIGKWETFHDNGRLASEVYYDNGYFLKNLWDSLGNKLVSNGEGRDLERYPNGVVAVDGEYKNGHKDGRWYGRHQNGDLYFEEIYNDGRLVSGKSRTAEGRTFVYDATSLFPLPAPGFPKFNSYLKAAAGKIPDRDTGRVKISFRVTAKGTLADVKIEQGASPILNAHAKEILLNGPAWLPARLHGGEPIDGVAFVWIDF